MVEEMKQEMQIAEVKECMAKSSPIIRNVLKIFLGMLARKAKNTVNEFDDKVVAFFRFIIG